MSAVVADDVRLRLTGVDKAFGGNHAVRGMDLEVRGGELVGLIGANGAGKTTLLNLASGILAPDAGRVQLGSADVTRRPAAHRARSGLARTFQHPRLVMRLTALENVMLGARTRRAGAGDLLALARGRREERRLMERAVAALGVAGVEESSWLQPVETIPTTEHRWIEVARCLAADPAVALFDEPTSGFAQSEVTQLRELLSRLVERSGLGVVLVTHDVSLAVTTCSRVVVMDHGRFLAAGTPAEILGNADVTRAYLGEKAHAAATEFLNGADDADGAVA